MAGSITVSNNQLDDQLRFSEVCHNAVRIVKFFFPILGGSEMTNTATK